jgi:hypothetical protein
MSGLETLPLHDAIVSRITLQWVERTLEFELLAFAERGKRAFPHKLKFTGVSNFNCPHASPWGESFFINSATGSSGSYVIEMQSGDEIGIEAAGYSFIAAAS